MGLRWREGARGIKPIDIFSFQWINSRLSPQAASRNFLVIPAGASALSRKSTVTPIGSFLENFISLPASGSASTSLNLIVDPLWPRNPVNSLSFNELHSHSLHQHPNTSVGEDSSSENLFPPWRLSLSPRVSFTVLSSSLLVDSLLL